MLIYIDRTIESHGKTIGLNDEERIFFSELAISHQQGNCMLSGEIKSIEWLMNELGGIHSAIYKQILNRHTAVRSIVELVETLLVLSYDNQPSLPSFFGSKHRVMNMQDALKYRINLQCSLVAENLEDCAFYELIAKRFLHDNKVKGINFSYHHELGGGDTINTVFQKCVEEDKVITLCLVDSDIKYGSTKKYPGLPARGVTVKKLEATHNKLRNNSNNMTFELYCLPIHEIENLIPLAVLESIATSFVPSMKPGMLYIQKLLKHNLVDAVLCYDFKNGGNKVKEDPSVTYWIEIAETIGDDSFPGLCSKVLEKAVEVLEGNTLDEQNRINSVVIDSHLLPYWNEIGLKVFSWGCASQPIRA